MRTAKIFIIIAITAISITGCDWVRSQLGMATSKELQALKLEEERMQNQMRIADSIEQARIDSAKVAAESVALEQQNQKRLITNKKYHVIIGSFKNHSNSARMVDNLTKKGYTPAVFNFKNGFEAVSVCGFDSLSAAFNEMYKLLNENFVPEDVWVYDIRQNLHN